MYLINVVSRHSELPILVIGHAVFADMIVPRFDRGAILFLPRRFARLPDLGGQPGLAGFADVDTQRLGFFDQRGAQLHIGWLFEARLPGPFESRRTVHRHSPCRSEEPTSE